MIRGEDLVAAQGGDYSGPEREVLRRDFLKIIRKYRPEWSGEMGDGTTGLLGDINRIQALIFRIEKWQIKPAREARRSGSRATPPAG